VLLGGHYTTGFWTEWSFSLEKVMSVGTEGKEMFNVVLLLVHSCDFIRVSPDSLTTRRKQRRNHHFKRESVPYAKKKKERVISNSGPPDGKLYTEKRKRFSTENRKRMKDQSH